MAIKKTYNDLSAGNWVLFGFSAQHAVIAWFLGLLAFLTFFGRFPRFEGNAIMSVQLRDWWAKISPYSTTLFRTIFWHANRPVPKTPEEELDTRHENHERKHVHQFEDACVQGFFLGLVLATLLWIFGWYAEAWQPALVWEITWLLVPLMLVPNWGTALLRYGPAAKYREDGTARSWVRRIYDTAYLDSEHERSARAQTEGFDSQGRSWAEREYEKRHMPRRPDGKPAAQ